MKVFRHTTVVNEEGKQLWSVEEQASEEEPLTLDELLVVFEGLIANAVEGGVELVDIICALQNLTDDLHDEL